MGSVNWRRRGNRYQVSWRLDDGSQGSRTVATREEAVGLAAEKRLEIITGAWKGRRRGRLSFYRWADDWWAVWSTDPTLSPNSLVMTESRLRNHLRPFFGPRAIEDITPRLLRQWQNQMATQQGYATVMACRSILFRILQFAEDENAIPANPMRKVPTPKRLVDPDVVLGIAKRRILTPEEAGVLLAAFPRFWWDHVITLLGCGLRISELAGLRRDRIDLDRGVLQVVDTRYQAGRKYGSGFKGPKSAAGVREVPLAPQVAEAIARRLWPGNDEDGLVFTGPGGGPGRAGGPGVPRGTRTVLSRDNFRRLYIRAVTKTSDPAASLTPTGRRVLSALRVGGRQTTREVEDRLGAVGLRFRPETVVASLARLVAGGLAIMDCDGELWRWSAVGVGAGPLQHLRLSGPHDLRHTFATWLEDAGIPARVIDELMGHAGGRQTERGSRVGRVYRHTTAEMRTRVVAAIEERLAITLEVAQTRREGSERPSSRARMSC
jgi:integrase